jgi:hypothetical protein
MYKQRRGQGQAKSPDDTLRIIAHKTKQSKAKIATAPSNIKSLKMQKAEYKNVTTGQNFTFHTPTFK